MKKIVLFLFTLFCVVGAKAQSDSTQQPAEADWEELEQAAVFPGGEKEMLKFISENLNYPDKALKKKIQGTVKVRFVIEKDGSVVNVETINENWAVVWRKKQCG